MTTHYCVDPGTASGTPPLPPKPYDYKLRVPKGDKVVFWHVDSCLGVDLVLKSGDQIAGHMALQMGGQLAPVDADGNATLLINEMGNLLKAGDVIEHVMLIYDSQGMWDTDGVWNQILAKNGAAHAPSLLKVDYGNSRITVTVKDIVVTTEVPDGKLGKSFFITEAGTKTPFA